MKREIEDDLEGLYQLLLAHKIPCEKRLHPISEKESQVKEIIGCFPAGKHQILVKKDRTIYSIIRGYASFGAYEIMNIGKGKKFKEPERFKTPEELIEALQK